MKIRHGALTFHDTVFETSAVIAYILDLLVQTAPQAAAADADLSSPWDIWALCLHVAISYDCSVVHRLLRAELVEELLHGTVGSLRAFVRAAWLDDMTLACRALSDGRLHGTWPDGPARGRNVLDVSALPPTWRNNIPVPYLNALKIAWFDAKARGGSADGIATKFLETFRFFQSARPKQLSPRAEPPAKSKPGDQVGARHSPALQQPGTNTQPAACSEATLGQPGTHGALGADGATEEPLGVTQSSVDTTAAQPLVKIPDASQPTQNEGSCQSDATASVDQQAVQAAQEQRPAQHAACQIWVTAPSPVLSSQCSVNAYDQEYPALAHHAYSYPAYWSAQMSASYAEPSAQATAPSSTHGRAALRPPWSRNAGGPRFDKVHGPGQTNYWR